MSYTRVRLAYRDASVGRGCRARAADRGRVRVRGPRGTRRRGARWRPPPPRSALIFAAFASPLQPLAVHTFLWAHLLQNVVLAEWAPALLVLAVPRATAARAAGFPLFRPFVALPLWLVTYFAWHLPWIYDYALRHPHSLLHVEHLTYLLAGICLWWPVIHGAYSAGMKALYLFAAFVLASPLGLMLALVQRPRLLVLRARAAHLGAGAARRPADRRRDDGGGGGDRLLRRLHASTSCMFLRDEQAHGAFEGLRGRDGW